MLRRCLARVVRVRICKLQPGERMLRRRLARVAAAGEPRSPHPVKRARRLRPAAQKPQMGGPQARCPAVTALACTRQPHLQREVQAGCSGRAIARGAGCGAVEVGGGRGGRGARAVHQRPRVHALVARQAQVARGHLRQQQMARLVWMHGVVSGTGAVVCQMQAARAWAPAAAADGAGGVDAWGCEWDRRG